MSKRCDFQHGLKDVAMTKFYSTKEILRAKKPS